ncbi:MAG: aldehyde dehydrogenase family protein [Bdellovibrionota bacterium]
MVSSTLDAPELAVPDAALTVAQRFLKQSVIPALVGGKPELGSYSGTFKVFDPGNTSEPIATVALMDGADVNRAAEQALKAFQKTDWARMTPSKRSELLHRYADKIHELREVVAALETLEAGKIYEQSLGCVDNCVTTLRYYADLAANFGWTSPVEGCEVAHYAHYQPSGVCGLIIPWNFPVILYGWGVAPALAAGNTVVIKPAENTPIATLYLASLASQAGIPDGVINVVPGFGRDAGAALAANPNLGHMRFTGSPGVAAAVGMACAQNHVPFASEAGGKGAAYVAEDADVEAAAKNLAAAITFHAGQVCCTATRIVLHRSVADAFLDKYLTAVKTVKIGHPMHKGTEMGPLVSEVQRQRVLGYVNRIRPRGNFLLEGAAVESAEGMPGCYVSPCIFEAPVDHAANQEEIFGPMAGVLRVGSDEEATRVVNSSKYGLSNSIFTADPERYLALAKAQRVGNVWHNAHNVFAPGLHYGGVGISGNAGVNSIDTMLQTCLRSSIMA